MTLEISVRTIATVFVLITLVSGGYVYYSLKESANVYCKDSTSYGGWEAKMEPVYFNETYPAVAQYECPLNNMIKWCGKLSGGKHSKCYGLDLLDNIEVKNVVFPEGDTSCLRVCKGTVELLLGTKIPCSLVYATVKDNKGIEFEVDIINIDRSESGCYLQPEWNTLNVEFDKRDKVSIDSDLEWGIYVGDLYFHPSWNDGELNISARRYDLNNSQWFNFTSNNQKNVSMNGQNATNTSNYICGLKVTNYDSSALDIYFALNTTWASYTAIVNRSYNYSRNDYMFWYISNNSNFTYIYENNTQAYLNTTLMKYYDNLPAGGTHYFCFWISLNNTPQWINITQALKVDGI